MMSMSYQLEILWYQVCSFTLTMAVLHQPFLATQAEHLRSLGWGEFLKVEMSRDRKALSVSYWM